MKLKGSILKLLTKYKFPIEYTLPIGKNLVSLNKFIGSKIEINFNGNIFCINCGKETKKSFNQGFCYPCFRKSPLSSECIIRPELCKAHLGLGRDIEWEKKYHLKDHIVYFAVSSSLKVGVTQINQIPTRWIDQGATYALPIARTPNRYLAGKIEVFLKNFYSDKTSWQKMLKNDFVNSNILEEKKKIYNNYPNELSNYKIDDKIIYNFEYPVLEYPKKISSISLDKTNNISQILDGIKGQYLIFRNNTVFNVRKHQGYEIDFSNI
ncbi:MAG: DUF2797 domain-containing protein [Flavobacteriales bacterium TMED288]|nr:hypothetical protein [Flavobacteriales bacterium]RPG53354.1 MAG: DUF2797 domain-containing protein [Flavobacteriales bacterium TMED288]|tara:strand:- start:5017 stop:5814 length:798 start_codon:yes stop_codon:yes gene_type:complete